MENERFEIPGLAGRFVFVGRNKKNVLKIQEAWLEGRADVRFKFTSKAGIGLERLVHCTLLPEGWSLGEEEKG